MANSHEIIVPFAEGKRATEFGRALLKKMFERVGELRKEMIPPENISALPHGHGWTFQQLREEGFVHETGKFKKHSTEVAVHNSQILSHDLNLIEGFVVELTEKIHAEFMASIIQEVSETSERFGRLANIPKDGSLAEGNLASLADIHASVDSDGNVSMPQVVLSPDMFERLQTELSQRGNVFQRKAEEIKARSAKDAMEREAERLAKYDQR